ncbi:hypothetical protein Tco_0527697 [Tanacetum coccineum]
MTTAGTRAVVNTGKGHLRSVYRIMHSVKLIPKDSPFELEAFSDSDYRGASLDRNQQQNMLQLLTVMGKLRATYDAELVSAASLVNTTRPTLSTAQLVYQSLILSQSIISHILIRVSMANLEFVDQHNMVACLEKTEGNFNFHEIVDFLASSSIHHALTINATVDSKAVVVTEASIRSSLLFNDADDIHTGLTLIKMKEEKAKEKGVSFKDIKDSSRPERSILTLKPLPTIDPKDKGKNYKRCRNCQTVTSRLASRGIDVDTLFAAKLQQEEREAYTIEERAKFLAETIAAQRKFRAAQRFVEIRNVMNEKETDEDTSNKEKVLKEPDSTKVEVKQEGHEDITAKDQTEDLR